MQLVFITHGCCTTFQIGNVAVLIGHDQCPLKLPGIHSIDTEISGKFHRAANPFGDIHEGTVAKNSAVQRGKKVVGIRDHRSHVFLYQVGMMFHRFAEGAENDAHLRQIFTKSSFHRNAVHHSIHRHSRQHFLLIEGNAEFIKGIEQFRIHFIQTFRCIFSGCCKIGHILVINFRYGQMRPGRHLHREPVSVGFQPEIQQPFGLVLLGRNQADHVLVQSHRDYIRFNIGGKTVFIIALGYFI